MTKIAGLRVIRIAGFLKRNCRGKPERATTGPQSTGGQSWGEIGGGSLSTMEGG